MNENRVVVLPEEQSNIIEWINSNYSSLNQNTNASGCFCDIEQILNINKGNSKNQEIYSTIVAIRNRIVEREKLQKYKTCEALPDLIYCMESGTKLHDHDDSGYKKTNDGIQIRFNVCIQKPEEGGRPIYAGKLIDLLDREYVICRAEIDKHSSEWIKGNLPKICISFGFIIDYADIHLFSNREKVIQKDLNYNNITCFTMDNSFNYAELLSKSEINYNVRYALDNSNILTSELESTIQNIAKCSLLERGIYFNQSIHSIEFLFSNDASNKFTNEYDRRRKTYPLLTTITTLGQSNSCIVFTNIDMESYKYKEIPQENVFFLCKSKENLTIIFDGSRYYSKLSFDELPACEDIYLKINIWEFQQTEIDGYTSDAIFAESSNYKVTNITDFGQYTIYNDNILLKMLYDNKNANEKKKIQNILTIHENSVIKVESKNAEKHNYDELYKKYGDIANDLFPFINSNNIIDTNRFYNNKILLNTLSKDVCYWIINESEKLNNWKDSPYLNYGKYLNIEKLPAVSNFILFSANFYIMQLSKSYDLDEKLVFNISDIFVTKYDVSIGVTADKKPDDSHFTMIIQLNDDSDYDGGEITIVAPTQDCASENQIRLKQGDMFVYNNNKLRTNGGVTKGEKYTLVFFINILI
jgi:hypothetical protein